MTDEREPNICTSTPEEWANHCAKYGVSLCFPMCGSAYFHGAARRQREIDIKRLEKANAAKIQPSNQ